MSKTPTDISYFLGTGLKHDGQHLKGKTKTYFYLTTKIFNIIFMFYNIFIVGTFMQIAFFMNKSNNYINKLSYYKICVDRLLRF